jgi:diguanylate cyclase (GGDEF)-like protein
MKRDRKSGIAAAGVHWEDIRRRLIERIWHAFFYLAMIGAPFSIYRSVVTGWSLLYSFHIALALVVITLTLRPRLVPIGVKAVLSIGILWGVGTAGLMSFGLLSNGINALLLTCMIVSMLYSMRAAIFCGVAIALSTAVAGIGFTTGYLVIPVDANAYVKNPIVWSGSILVPILFTILVIISISVFQESIRALLAEVQRQRDVIAHQAIHDSLTGLPSLRLATDRLEVSIHRAHRSNTKVALMFVDLDGFKTVNDGHGHDAGDYVLTEVGKRLKQAVRTADTAARIGGDEFLVVLSEIPDRRVAAEVAEKIIRAIAEPILFKDQPLSVTASIGISVFPDDGGDVRLLKRVADQSMYGVKRAGKNNYAFSGNEMTSAAS